MVGWDGTTKLGDFGWQRLNGIIAPLGQVEVSDHATATVLMAPEQARGGAVTAKSDVFCAARRASRVATGRTPYARFRDTATGVLLAMSEGKVLPLTKTRPELPAAVREVFDRALAPDPDARTVTAQELADAVRAGFDMPRGKASIVKLLDRWREQLEKSMTPWERSSPTTSPTSRGGRTRRTLSPTPRRRSRRPTPGQASRGSVPPPRAR